MALKVTASPVRPFSVARISGMQSTVIQEGDSWETISERLYGDTRYAIAVEAYGNVPCVAGQVINGKQVMDAYCKALDFTPYQQLSSAFYNSLNPALPIPLPPPPPPPHHEA